MESATAHRPGLLLADNVAASDYNVAVAVSIALYSI